VKKLMIFAVLCLCFANFVNAQGRRQYKDVDIVNGKTVVRSTGQLVNGAVCFYGSNGNIMFETLYKDGEEEGVRYYYKSGKLKNETPYKNGRQEGIEKWYYENGRLQREIPYKDDKWEGIWKEYYENGKLESEGPCKNNKREGYYHYYTESGKLRLKILYRNGEPVTGTCGDGRPLTNAELVNWNNGHDVECE